MVARINGRPPHPAPHLSPTPHETRPFSGLTAWGGEITGRSPFRNQESIRILAQPSGRPAPPWPGLASLRVTIPRRQRPLGCLHGTATCGSTAARVVGAYDLGKLDKEFLAVLMEPHRGTDIDNGARVDLQTKDAKGVEKIVIEVWGLKMPMCPVDNDSDAWEDYDNAAWEQMSVIKRHFGWRQGETSLSINRSLIAQNSPVFQT